MDWNADLYETKHDFVAEYGRDLLSHVPDIFPLLAPGTADRPFWTWAAEPAR